jgi:Na+/H+ antiporter NhaC
MKKHLVPLAAAFAAMIALNAGAQADVAAAAEEAAAATATAVEEAVEAVAEAVAPVAEEAADLSDAEAAQEYIDGYADNVQEDPDFKANVEKALATIRADRPAYGTFWAVFPPLLAIVLALVTKEVYSSLFVGILAGGLIWSKFSFEGTIVHVFNDGFIASVADSDHAGILIFLVLLGALVSMMSKTGGSAAFGRWAETHIRSRIGAQIATIFLGLLIFIDDYFNCLTVGSVMKPVTDAKKISRAKLAYLIDATAAPICIIAPVSSWAAAVADYADKAGAESGFVLFCRAIPYNFYAILTIVMLLFVAISGFDFGGMKKHERNALAGDLFTTGKEPESGAPFNIRNDRGRVYDLLVPVVVLIAACTIGMLYTGGYFTEGSDYYRDFRGAFGDCTASTGLVYGSGVTIVFSVIYFLCRRVISFKDCMGSLPDGFKSMVPAIMILCCAWTLNTMTGSLGAKIYISQLVEGSAAGLKAMLPAIVFAIAAVLAFSSGTSWGTFGILIPIVLAVFPASDPLMIISMSACMAGAVCGDHCSPISDTTIMASAGADCNHINHVNTQLPYAVLVAAVSFVAYVVAAFVKNVWISLPVAIVLMLATLFVLRAVLGKAKAEA